MSKPKRVNGKTIPAWFLKDLKIIDPTYFITWNKHYRYFEIRKKLHKEVVDKQTGKKAVFHNPVVATYFKLIPSAIENMRERKYTGLHKSGIKYLNWIVEQNKAEKEKRKDMNRKLLAEILMDFHKFGKKKSINYGGKDDRGGDKNRSTQHFKGILDRHGRPFRK